MKDNSPCISSLLEAYTIVRDWTFEDEFPLSKGKVLELIDSVLSLRAERDALRLRVAALEAAVESARLALQDTKDVEVA